MAPAHPIIAIGECSMEIDQDKIVEFADPMAFYDWLAINHARETEVWVKIHKLRSGRRSVTPQQAIEMALCWGWIDGLRKRFDDASFMQRYSRRRPQSNWSRINAASVNALIGRGLMRPSGLAAVERAFAKGRWPADLPLTRPRKTLQRPPLPPAAPSRSPKTCSPHRAQTPGRGSPEHNSPHAR